MSNQVKQLFESGLVWHAANSAGDDARDSSKGALRACFGIESIDQNIVGGGLCCGALHEWFPIGTFFPPCGVITLLITNALQTMSRQPLIERRPIDQFDQRSLDHGHIDHGHIDPGHIDPGHIDHSHNGCTKLLLWIGARLRPTPFLLDALHSISLFIDPPDRCSLLWTVETALRSPAVAAVIADLPILSFAGSRRLARAAQQGDTLGFLIRSGDERKIPTAAATRWSIAPRSNPHSSDVARAQLSAAAPASDAAPGQSIARWEIALLKQKGAATPLQPWIVELNLDDLSLSLDPKSQIYGEALPWNISTALVG